jgi:hypothetical protein
MRNVVLFVKFSFLIFLAISCSENKVKREIFRTQKTKQSEVLKVDNPAMFKGKTFGHFMPICHKIGDYQQMLKFTSNETREEYGDSVLIEFYENIQFSYPLELRSKILGDNGSFTLYYITNIGATNKTIQIEGVIEKDTCKVILKRLDKESPFIGI